MLNTYNGHKLSPARMLIKRSIFSVSEPTYGENVPSFILLIIQKHRKSHKKKKKKDFVKTLKVNKFNLDTNHHLLDEKSFPSSIRVHVYTFVCGFFPSAKSNTIIWWSVRYSFSSFMSQRF